MNGFKLVARVMICPTTTLRTGLVDFCPLVCLVSSCSPRRRASWTTRRPVARRLVARCSATSTKWSRGVENSIEYCLIDPRSNRERCLALERLEV